MNLGLPGALTVIFTITKLGGWIDWSWWWVFSPVWIGATLGIVLTFIYVMVKRRF